MVPPVALEMSRGRVEVVRVEVRPGGRTQDLQKLAHGGVRFLRCGFEGKERGSKVVRIFAIASSDATF